MKILVIFHTVVISKRTFLSVQINFQQSTWLIGRINTSFETKKSIKYITVLKPHHGCSSY